MKLTRKVFYMIFMLFLSIALYACQNNDDLDNEKLITNIDVINNELTVSYLDGSKNNLGSPERLAGNEIGVSEITFNSNGQIVAVLTNQEVVELGYFVGSSGELIELKLGPHTLCGALKEIITIKI